MSNQETMRVAVSKATSAIVRNGKTVHGEAQRLARSHGMPVRFFENKLRATTLYAITGQ